MKRQRAWKDRRAWVEHQSADLAQKHTKRYAWWKAIIGFIIPKLGRKWRKAYANYSANVAHYITKKLSHDLEKNEPGEFERCKRQVARAKRRHEAFLAAHPERVNA
jgi:hypothetical protein